VPPTPRARRNARSSPAARKRRRPGELEDLGDEAVPPARDGHDVPVVVGPLSQRLAEGGDVLGEVGLGDEGVRPDPPDQLLLLHHLAPILQQDEQDRERLGSEGYRLPAFEKAPPDGIDTEAVELVDPLLGPGGQGARRHGGFGSRPGE
jgi:hypothetical protein